MTKYRINKFEENGTYSQITYTVLELDSKERLGWLIWKISELKNKNKKIPVPYLSSYSSRHVFNPTVTV